eukprot:11689981-Alexandrium_andersonii.AAC.1
MSASLVGSEMCIRDRPSCPLRGSESAKVGDPPCSIARRRRRRAKRGASCCLLYTSDAADDM